MTVTISPGAWELLLAGTPALTLRNPWADYVAHHGKNVENRTWRPPPPVTWFLIHAGAGWDNVPDHLVPAGDLNRPATSAIVALTRIESVCPAVPGMCRCGRWAAAGQYHWRLTGTVALPQPVSCTGRLKFWYPTRRVLTAVAEQLAQTHLS